MLQVRRYIIFEYKSMIKYKIFACFLIFCTLIVASIFFHRVDIDYKLTNRVVNGDDSSVYYYLKSGADVNNTRYHGLSPIRASVVHNHYKTAVLLLSHGANSNDGLYVAAMKNNVNMALLMLDNKADAFSKSDEMMQTPFEIASPEMKKIILAHAKQSEQTLP